jgi:hypothetical protein
MIYYISSKMNNKNITHRNPIEESRDCTTFEGSLQSKMSSKNLSYDQEDNLRVKRQIHFFNSKEVTPIILIKEVLKQRITADLHVLAFIRIFNGIPLVRKINQLLRPYA